MTKPITPQGAVRIYNRAATDVTFSHWSQAIAVFLRGTGPAFYQNGWSSIKCHEQEEEIENIDRAIERLTQIRDGLEQSIGE